MNLAQGPNSDTIIDVSSAAGTQLSEYNCAPMRLVAVDANGAFLGNTTVTWTC